MAAVAVMPSINSSILKEDERTYRDFSSPSVPQHVKDTYKYMHTHQTLEFVKQQNEYWGQLNHGEMSIMEALDQLENYVDPSDPDINLAQSYHGFQVAERIRAVYPDNEWFQLTGLIHDCGKMMGMWGQPSWSTVGDTFPVGCAPVEQIVFGVASFVDNLDMKDPNMKTKFGIYEENCGLDQLWMSWGHDEYLYKVLKGNKHYLPENAMYVIRFHSFYPWHTDAQYYHFCTEKDLSILPYVQEFQKHDLYTKTDKPFDIDAVKPYYEKLVEKYIPGKLKW